jgi:hypothetical protein
MPQENILICRRTGKSYGAEMGLGERVSIIKDQK